MAAKNEGLKITGVVYASPAKFRLVPAFQGRVNPVAEDDLIALADSMRTEGQTQPIQSRPIKGSDEYEVIFGNSRKLAADLIVAGYKSGNGKDVKGNPDFKLRAEIVDVDDQEAFRRNIVENAMRNACTPIDTALNQARLRDEQDMSDASIARLYGYGQANVTRLKKLLELPEEIQQEIHKGNCSARAGFLLANATDVVDAGAFDAVWMKLKDGDATDGANFGESQMAAAIKEWRTEQKQAATVAAATPEGTPTAPDGTPAVEGGTTTAPVAGTPTNAPTIGLSYKEFKDVFRGNVASPRVPEKTKELSQFILDLAEGKVEPKDFGVFILQAFGEELLPPPEEVPGQEGSAAVEVPTETTEQPPVESPVPQQQPANNAKRKTVRK